MKKQNILIINICKEQLHYFEFVRPIEDIVTHAGKNFFTKHYSDIGKKDLEMAERVIICGTSLKDNDFMNDVKQFSWLTQYDKPVLGICGGMQIIGMVFGNTFRNFGKWLFRKKTARNKVLLKKKNEIGFYKERFNKDFLGLSGEIEVYHLHNYYIDFSLITEFEIFCKQGKVVQAVKHREKNIFGVLFHPEVRNQEIIRNFISL